MTDHDAHGPAIALIARDLARARDDGADDEVTARHILTDLMGHGWRRVIEPPPGPGGPATPPTAEFLAARAAMEPGAGAVSGEQALRTQLADLPCLRSVPHLRDLPGLLRRLRHLPVRLPVPLVPGWPAQARRV